MTTQAPTTATGFAAEFPSTEREWRDAATKALKGRPLEPLLTRRTLDDVVVEAIAPRAPVRPIAGRPAGAPWIAMTRIDIADPKAANAQALEDLANGATGLALVFAEAGGRGLVADTLDRLDATLDGVMLDLITVHLDVAPFEGRSTAALFAALAERRGLDPAALDMLFGFDLVRNVIMTGALPRPWADMRRRFAGVLKGLRARGYASPVAMLDLRVAHSVGANAPLELATALASATEHVRALADHGVEIEVAADAIALAFSCDADQFVSIGKLRAMRLLWAAWRREAGLPDRPVRIHAETSRRMMTTRDSQTNMVRATIAAFAAGVGGADSVTVLPHSFAIGGSTADARRIARNVQTIVMEESHAHRVADPAAGAGAIEKLTDRLAEEAWEVFRDIEREGGFFASTQSGTWQQRAIRSRDARAAAVATRKSPIVGVSEFPQADESVPRPSQNAAPATAGEVKPLGGELGEDEAAFERVVGAYLDGASFADVRKASRHDPSVFADPMPLERVAAPFEALRAENEAAAQRPAVFLALVGPVAKHAARAGFIRNLFVAGGVAPLDGPVDAEPDAAAEAFAESRAGLAVVCGSDEGYEEIGAALVAALARRGAPVWLAGRPKESAAALEAAGATRFVAAGDDALAILREASAIARQGAKAGARQ